MSIVFKAGEQSLKIEYFNRHTQRLEEEKVYGDRAVRWLYESFLGRILAQFLVCRPLSWLYGLIQSSPLSKRKISPFIKKFQISMDDFLPSEGRNELDPYASFNEFFIRRFKEGRRPFVSGDEFPAFCEARYFGYESLTKEKKVPVKGRFLDSKALLADSHWASFFEKGPLLLARLCPVDYHRFHFPDEGRILHTYRIPGVLHSVNPLALTKKPDIFMINERQVSILETKRFGKLAYIEVGAICVGKIYQSFEDSLSLNFSRGGEKGRFLFGGSTVIVLGEKGKWRPSEDILENTERGIETYLYLGTPAGATLNC